MATPLSKHLHLFFINCKPERDKGFWVSEGATLQLDINGCESPCEATEQRVAGNQSVTERLHTQRNRSFCWDRADGFMNAPN